MADRRLLPGLPRSGSALVERLRDLARSAPTQALERAGLSVAATTERVLKRVEQVTETFQQSVDMQQQLMRKLAPVVDDLGKLVRLQLEEGRRRREQARAEVEARRSKAPVEDPNIIDTTAV